MDYDPIYRFWLGDSFQGYNFLPKLLSNPNLTLSLRNLNNSTLFKQGSLKFKLN